MPSPQAVSQFSTRNDGTRSNSRVLAVTRVRLVARVLEEKLGFQHTGEWMDEEDGLEWVFVREKQL